jgi:uncharacterized protein with GYD domain
MGMKIVQAFWTMGAYDVVVLLEAPDDENPYSSRLLVTLWPRNSP